MHCADKRCGYLFIWSMVALSEHANPLGFELSRVWEGRSASLSLVSRHSISRGFTWFSRRYELSNTVIWLCLRSYHANQNLCVTFTKVESCLHMRIL